MRARRTDTNHDEIARAFEKMGCTVYKINDVVDLMVGYGGYTRLVEVRQAGQKRKAREGRQKRFHDTWTGGVYWIQTLDDVSACVASMRLHVNLIRNQLIAF